MIGTYSYFITQMNENDPNYTHGDRKKSPIEKGFNPEILNNKEINKSICSNCGKERVCEVAYKPTIKELNNINICKECKEQILKDFKGKTIQDIFERKVRK
jgi:hypothetical protein